MRKMLFKFTFVLMIFFISIVSVFAAVNIITKSGSISWNGTWTVSASSLWEYETGKYNGPGSFTLTTKPNDGLLTLHWVEFNSSSAQGEYSAHQYYLPVKRVQSILGDITYYYGPIIDIAFSSPGPMRADY